MKRTPTGAEYLAYDGLFGSGNITAVVRGFRVSAP
jgi:hypothetical protein